MSRWWALFFLVAIPAVHSAKILGLFPLPSKSHLILAHTLFRELASRGHEVTMISPFPMENPPDNYQEVILKDILDVKDKHTAAAKDQSKSAMEHAYILFKGLQHMERVILGDKELTKFLDRKPKFDLVIQLWYMNEALLGVGHAVNAPTIGFSVMGGAPFQIHLTANPTPYSYVPNMYLPFTDKMNFFQRLINTLGHGFMDLYMHFINMPFQSGVLQQYFPNAPPLDQLLGDVDLIFVNSHYSTLSPRPQLPGIIEIGGFHLQDKQELSGEIKSYMDNSKNGVILFSLGTNAGVNDITNGSMEAIIRTFKNTKYDILWKFGEPIENLPKNVKIVNWLPQRGVLAHNNTKAFITHGGLGSIIEAIHSAVPLICFPIFTDQPKNVADVVAKGFGIGLDLTNVEEKTFGAAIEEVTNNPSYLENVMYYSDLLRNQEVNPMEKAVYWVEHAIRHKGAKHLRSRGSDLPWYQYMLIDVIGFILLILLLVVVTVKFGVKKLCRMCCRPTSTNKKLKVK